MRRWVRRMGRISRTGFPRPDRLEFPSNKSLRRNLFEVGHGVFVIWRFTLASMGGIRPGGTRASMFFRPIPFALLADELYEAFRHISSLSEGELLRRHPFV